MQYHQLLRRELSSRLMLIALFSFGAGDGLLSAADPAGSGPRSFGRQGIPSMASGKANGSLPIPAAGLILREGTRVGPITGRFVLSGHRWRFLPERPPSPGHNISETLVQRGLARQPSQDEDTLLGQKQPIGRGIGTFDSSNLEDPDLPIAPATITVPMTLVTENLMLDRISRAIEEDSNDDRWTITGYVTEFRDENRLVIETSVRAPMVPNSRSVLDGR